MKSKKHIISVIQLLLCICTIWAIETESSFVWLPTIPWLILNFFGIILTLPILFLLGLGIGAAQADWMPDEFIFIVLFIIPTGVSIAFNYFISRKVPNKQSEKESITKDLT